MDMSQILTAISSVGFPIVMCLIMAKYTQENDDKNRTQINELSVTIANNTNVMTKLVERLEANGQ